MQCMKLHKLADNVHPQSNIQQYVTAVLARTCECTDYVIDGLRRLYLGTLYMNDVLLWNRWITYWRGFQEKMRRFFAGIPPKYPLFRDFTYGGVFYQGGHAILPPGDIFVGIPYWNIGAIG